MQMNGLRSGSTAIAVASADAGDHWWGNETAADEGATEENR